MGFFNYETLDHTTLHFIAHYNYKLHVGFPVMEK